LKELNKCLRGMLEIRFKEGEGRERGGEEVTRKIRIKKRLAGRNFRKDLPKTLYPRYHHH